MLTIEKHAGRWYLLLGFLPAALSAIHSATVAVGQFSEPFNRFLITAHFKRRRGRGVSMWLLLFAILLAWSTACCLAQGYMGFGNASTFFYPPDGIDRLVRFDASAIAVNPFGTNLAPAVTNFVPGLRAQLYYGAATNTEDQLVAITNAPATFRSSTSSYAGAWIPSVNAFCATPFPFNGEFFGPVNFQVRVWDISRAATFEDATADPNYDGVLGKSQMISQSWWWQYDPRLYDLRSFTVGFKSTAPRFLVHDGMLGFRSNQFGFNISARTGSVVVIEGSPDLSNWTSLATNYIATNPAYFSDPGSPVLKSRFYRARSN